MPVGCQRGHSQCLIKSAVTGQTDINNTGRVHCINWDLCYLPYPIKSLVESQRAEVSWWNCRSARTAELTAYISSVLSSLGAERQYGQQNCIFGALHGTNAGCVPFIQSLISLVSSSNNNKASSQSIGLVAQKGRSAIIFSVIFQVDVFCPNTGSSAWIFQTPLFSPAEWHEGPWKKLRSSVRSMGPAGAQGDHGSSFSSGKAFLYTVTRTFVFSVDFASL